jgi:uncharacterized protein (TIGR02246 family)
MSEYLALARRIDRLESRNAITELVATYGRACDDHDMTLLMTLFTEDACLDTPSGLMQAQGRDAICTMFEQVLATRGPSFHWSHDHTITFDDADDNAASGLTLSHAETSPGGVVSVAAMRYEDAYRREAGMWKFARRTLHFLYYVPVTEFATCLNGPERLYVGGEPRAADYPESLPAWKAFFAAHGD